MPAPERRPTLLPLLPRRPVPCGPRCPLFCAILQPYFVYAFLSLAVFVVAAIPVAFVPEHVAFPIGMPLPIVALIMFGRATKVLDGRQPDTVASGASGTRSVFTPGEARAAPNTE